MVLLKSNANLTCPELRELLNDFGIPHVDHLQVFSTYEISLMCFCLC